MRYALIGCGRIAPRHLAAALENGLAPAAVCDVDIKQSGSLLRRFDLDLPQYQDAAAMLDTVHPELVSIASDSGSHAALALACIRRGVHVIVEKPMALSLADADAMLREAAQRRVTLAVCHQNRFNPAVRAMAEAVADGRFGRLSHAALHLRWNRGSGYYAQAAWRGRWASDGGCLMNQGIHGIDILRWLMGGAVREVYGQTRRRLHPGIEAEDVGLAVVSFADGAVASIEGTVNVYPENLEESLYLFGERGSAALGGKALERITLWDFADARPGDSSLRTLAEATGDVYGNGHTALFADVIDAIRRRRPPLVSAQAGRDALELVLAVYQSQLEHRPAALPLGSFSSAQMAGVFD